MQGFLELLGDNDSTGGLLVTTGVIVGVAVLLGLGLGAAVRRRFRDDPYRRYWAPKLVRYALGAIAAIALIALWAPLGGRLSVILGFATAGIAFAMQEVIGAFFGWINIISGRIYTVGDRVEVGGVRGDVIDLTPLRTTVMEMGSSLADGEARESWVGARQPTGRVVSVSNKKTFTDPVFNYSAHFEWLWEELAFGVPYDADWPTAERIIREAIVEHRPERRDEREAALTALSRRYLLSRAEVDATTFIAAREHWVEITGRFVTPVRTARSAKDAITRRVLERLDEAGIPLAHPTYEVRAAGRTGRERTEHSG